MGPKGSDKQCASLAYDYCCDVGTPCDCSKGPDSGPVTCAIIDTACSTIFHSAATSILDCALDDSVVVAACEAAGLGPEDPLADACAAILATTVSYACEQAIKAGGKFAAQQCEKAAGCSGESVQLVV